MTACSDIESKLTKELAPSHLEVIDESYLHNVEPGKESHVRIVVVSEQFEGLNLVKRHQLIYQQINEELGGVVTSGNPNSLAALWNSHETYWL